jgi:hypothetical protein
MGQIHFPPPGVFTSTIVPLSTCYTWGEDLTVIFDAPGFFVSVTPGCFTPDLPAGTFVATNQIGPYYAVTHDATAILVFYDPAADKLYVETVTIMKTCAKTKPKPKPKPKKK